MDRNCLYADDEGSAMWAMLKNKFLVVFVDRERLVSPLTVLMHFPVADRAALGFCVASHGLRF